MTTPYEPAGARFISKSHKIAYAEILFDVQSNDVPVDLATHMRKVAEDANSDHLRVELGGYMFTDQTQPASEAIGVLAAVFILLIAFGSLLAMGLPIMTALFGIGIGLAIVNLLARVLDVPSFAPQVTAMIGIGVGIDYALFIATRYRESLHDGADPEDAVVYALDTSGRAVLFAGSTVVISLLGLFLIGVSFIRGLAVGASLAVLFVMAAAVTLLPAVLGFVGHTIDKFALPSARKHKDVDAQLLGPLEPHAPGPPVARGDRRPPRPRGAGGTGPVAAARRRRLRQRPDQVHDPPRLRPAEQGIRSRLQRTAAARRARWARRPTSPSLPTSRRTIAKRPRRRRRWGRSIPSPNGKGVLIQVVPKGSPQDESTTKLVHRLRERRRARGDAGIDARHARRRSDRDRRRPRRHPRVSACPYMFVAILLFSFVLLMLVFRSLLVPLKAVIMNLLSIGAAYGVIVAIFQWGWVKGALGIGKEGPIEAWVPMMLFAIVFGLSMDYEVFLLSRIKEEYDRSHDNASAVALGLAKTARLITAAAAIMICVFGSFVLSDLRVLKLVGFGLAFAVFIDATVVRLVLVPATMELLGDRNWWFPSWLEWLPRVHIEGGEPPVAAPDVVREPQPVGGD